MRKTVTAYEGTTLTVEVPYTRLSEQHEALYYKVLNGLLAFANRVLGLVAHPGMALDSPDPLAHNAGAYVLEALWANRWLIERFVKLNPCGFSREERMAALGWTHAVRDLFTCIYADEDLCLYQNGRRVFALGAQLAAKGAHPPAPEPAELCCLTMLPFKGGIVTDGAGVCLGPWPEGAPRSHLRLTSSLVLYEPVVSRATDLIAYRQAYKGQNQISSACQQFLQQGLLARVPAELRLRQPRVPSAPPEPQARPAALLVP